MVELTQGMDKRVSGKRILLMIHLLLELLLWKSESVF